MADDISQKKKSIMAWQLSALMALICFSGAFLAFRATGQSGVSPAAMLLPVMTVGAILTACQMATAGATLAMPARAWLMMLFAAIACWVGNLAQLDAVNRAPNPGAALAIINASVAVVALVAWPLFGDVLSPGKIAGVVCCVVGILIVSMCP